MKCRQHVVPYQCALCLLGTLCLLATSSGCGEESNGDGPDDGMPLLNIVREENTEPPSQTLERDEKDPARQPRVEKSSGVQVGQRFPLLRTVDQTLTQATAAGEVTSRSRLELLLTLSVEDREADDRTRFGVDYQRVRYVRTLGGETIEYDSHVPGSQPSLEIAPYHGLVDNGFSFWVDSRHRVTDLVGVEEFLQRCVRAEVGPPLGARNQASVLASVSHSNNGETPRAEWREPSELWSQAVHAWWNRVARDGGMTDFVEESIGLLPVAVERDQNGSPRRTGDAWTHTRHIRWPLSMYVRNQYTLKAIDEKTAEVEVVGTIAPATTAEGAGRGPDGVRVTLRGGRSFGRCRLRRGVGLPIESRIEYLLDMGVQSPDGTRFTQHKRIVSTVQAFEPVSPSAKTD